MAVARLRGLKTRARALIGGELAVGFMRRRIPTRMGLKTTALHDRFSFSYTESSKTEVSPGNL